VLGYFVIDDVRYPLDVDAAAGDIRGDHYIDPAEQAF